MTTYPDISDEYRSAIERARSAKKVFLLYSSVEDNGAVRLHAEKARVKWEGALEQQCEIQASIIKDLSDKNNDLNEKLETLNIQNDQLTKDKNRLLNQLRKSLGVEPKAMKGSEKPPCGSNPKEGDAPSEEPQEKPSKKRGAPKGHKGNTAIPTSPTNPDKVTTTANQHNLAN